MFNCSFSNYSLCMKTVLLVDKHGNPQGTAGLLEAHSGKGQLHRAFSVFVFRKDGDKLLLQQRSEKKPLFPLLWANTCCSHPSEDGGIAAIAEQRLQEEMGFTCPLQEKGSFVYRAEDPGRGTEHEHDTILIGNMEDEMTITPDPDEVADWRWVSLTDLQDELDAEPEKFAPWFSIALSNIFDS